MKRHYRLWVSVPSTRSQSGSNIILLKISLFSDHVVSKKVLLDIVFASPDFKHLYIIPENHTNAWKIDFFINPPKSDPWVKVINNPYYTKERILKHQTFIGIMDSEAIKYPTDSFLRWKEMNPLWSRGSEQIINNVKIKKKYFEAMLKSSLAEGVQYLETRRILAGRLYELDPSPQYEKKNGHKLLDDKNGTVELDLLMKLITNFTKEHTDFIGMKFIIYSSRNGTNPNVAKMIDRVIEFHKKYPSWIVAYDLVAEEDTGKSHLFFLENLLKLTNATAKKHLVNLIMHTGETNFPTDEKLSVFQMDPTSAEENTYDAIVLGVKRVGHGLGYIKHPYLMTVLKQRRIAVEACPISNQLLGYIADLRNHPAQSYIRYGIPVVMGSDDPGTFGYDNFTVDWYMAYLGWGLDLADLKLLGINALNYSAMNQAEKDAALQKYSKSWGDYISKMKKKACLSNIKSKPVFAKLLPNEGAISKPTKVYIYGNNFQAGICKDVKCKFGTQVSPAELISTQMIACDSPVPASGKYVKTSTKSSNLIFKPHHSKKVSSVRLYVSLDGKTYSDTKLNFTYKYSSCKKRDHSDRCDDKRSLNKKSVEYFKNYVCN